MIETKQGWHFVDKKLRDGRDIPPDGEWLEHDGKLEMCMSGLHFSERIIDALQYAPGNTICRVSVDGKIVMDTDKGVATRRRIDWRIDGEVVLRAFARWCAIQVIHLWNAPDVVVSYLATGDESLRDAARDAAWDAAWDARDAAWAAARYAAQELYNAKFEQMIREAKDGKTEWVFDIPKRDKEAHHD